MDEKVKQLWVKALRSGQFKQGLHQLRQDTFGGRRYCVLGVLCAVYEQQLKTSATFNWKSGVLPYNVQKWAGLSSDDPVVSEFTLDALRLSALNDEGHSFQDIAFLIESKL